MKKMFMLIGAIACTIGVQAASIDWSVTSNSWYLDDAKTTKAAMGTTVYLIDGAQWSSIQSAINNGTFSGSEAGVLDAASTSNGKGQILSRTATSGSLVAGQVYDFAYLVLNGDQYFASATQSFAAYDYAHPTYNEANIVPFAGSHFTTGTLSGGWATKSAGGGGSEGIPEPTSSLLLLVGGALLALRRKQK